jgi:hypothetical protein
LSGWKAEGSTAAEELGMNTPPEASDSAEPSEQTAADEPAPEETAPEETASPESALPEAASTGCSVSIPGR